MVITRTPLRISFFGGGTDYPVWIKKNGGLVLGTTIDKYCFISCRNLPPFFDHAYRVVYSKIENARAIKDIIHPSVKACLNYVKNKTGLEIHYDSDLPARSGLGSSSAFTVGLLHCLNALKGNLINKENLAREAIHVEQKIIKENVGCQDQIHAAFGGFNLIEFKKNDEIFVHPVTISKTKLKLLNKNLALFYTGVSRFASDIAGSQIKKTVKKEKELNEMQSLVEEAVKVLSSNNNHIDDFGKLLHETWLLKRSLTEKISNGFIDDIYSKGIKAGASGGKLLGAGGGGFMLFYCNHENLPNLKKKLHRFLHVPFNFENSGSQIIFYQPE